MRGGELNCYESSILFFTYYPPATSIPRHSNRGCHPRSGTVENSARKEPQRWSRFRRLNNSFGSAWLSAIPETAGTFYASVSGTAQG